MYSNDYERMAVNNDLISCGTTEGDVGGNLCLAEGSDASSSSYSGKSEMESDTSDSSTSSTSSCAASASLREKVGHEQAGIPAKSGGVMSFVRKRAFSAAARCSHSTLVPGRCIEILVNDNDISTYFINTHFHGLYVQSRWC